MKVLIGCEFSGVVREAFRRRGHDARSCDLLPAADGSPFHYQGDVLDLIAREYWDLAIFHPPCTYLCNASVWALSRTPPNPSPGALYGETRRQAMIGAARFFRSLFEAPIKRIALENPVMHGAALAIIGQRPAQSIQPYDFGEDASKRTCLWLKGLPRLTPTHRVAPRVVDGKPRWANQTDSGQNKIPPSTDRWKIRAQTYHGIAEAMAAQWGASDAWQLTA